MGLKMNRFVCLVYTLSAFPPYIQPQLTLQEITSVLFATKNLDYSLAYKFALKSTFFTFSASLSKFRTVGATIVVKVRISISESTLSIYIVRFAKISCKYIMTCLRSVECSTISSNMSEKSRQWPDLQILILRIVSFMSVSDARIHSSIIELQNWMNIMASKMYFNRNSDALSAYRKCSALAAPSATNRVTVKILSTISVNIAVKLLNSLQLRLKMAERRNTFVRVAIKQEIPM